MTQETLANISSDSRTAADQDFLISMGVTPYEIAEPVSYLRERRRKIIFETLAVVQSLAVAGTLLWMTFR